MGDPLLRERVAERPDDRRLADDRLECERPPAPREHLVAHQAAGRGRRAPRRGKSGRAPAVDGRRPAISPERQLRPGNPTAHERVCGPLLPSGPGGVGRFSSRGAQPSSPLLGAQFNTPAPRAGIQPRWSGLRVQGTATSPPSTATLDHLRPHLRGESLRLPAQDMAEREGFEPSIRLLDVYTISSRAPSAARAPLPGLGRPARTATPRGEKMAEGVRFEPTWGLITPNSISSRARCDHFGTPPHVASGRTPASARPPRQRARRR